MFGCIKAVFNWLFGKKTVVKSVTGRSTDWPAARRQFLKEHDYCAACGYQGPHLQVHHIIPVSWDRSLELNPSNMITLCDFKANNCHLRIGHLGDYKSANYNVVQDAAWWLSKIKTRPYLNK